MHPSMEHLAEVHVFVLEGAQVSGGFPLPVTSTTYPVEAATQWWDTVGALPSGPSSRQPGDTGFPCGYAGGGGESLITSHR